MVFISEVQREGLQKADNCQLAYLPLLGTPRHEALGKRLLASRIFYK